MKLHLLVALLIIGNSVWGQSYEIDISGEWRFALDSVNIGEKDEWFNTNLKETIMLPGSTDQGGYGTPHINGEKLYTGDSEIWQLARNRVYIGKAWYQKEINISKKDLGKKMFLQLERCMWQTKLWVNGKYIGENHSLCAPHVFEISQFMRDGNNLLTLQIDNSPYVNLGTWSHGYSPGLQTIWNGAIGNIAIKINEPIYIEGIQCYPSLYDKKLRVRAKIVNSSDKIVNGHLKFTLLNSENKKVMAFKKTVKVLPGISDFDETMTIESEIMAWDEFTPNLYTLEVKSRLGNNIDTENVEFGFRDVSIQDGQLVINGSKVFLRGEHDGGSFPITGYPSMEKKDWLHILKNGKDYGLNHWRFHSWCPPKAAFEAADELGVYLQTELTLFSQDWEHTLIGQDTLRDQFLFSELKRLLDTYGNHPSFLVMCMGNELRGKDTILEEWTAWGKSHDNRHLYVGSANLEAMGKYLPLKGDDIHVAHSVKVDGVRYERRMGGSFNTEKPNTEKDYSKTVSPPYNKFPGIIHEMGQWTVYPDYSEIGKYTGVMSPRNLEVFKESLKQKGMLDQASDFLYASGKLASILYKEEMERSLRTPGMGGFQLLDLRDYPAQGSALVGLLNVFWEPKGFINAEEFRESCNSLTVLLKMPTRIWQNNETFKAEIIIPNYTAKDIDKIDVRWSIKVDGREIASKEIQEFLLKQGDIHHCGLIEFPLASIQKASKLEVHLSVPSLNITNKYNFWVYPAAQEEDLMPTVHITNNVTLELLKQIEEGLTVLLVPNKLSDGERTTFTTPFWSSILFDYQPKTMGILCDSQHEIFKDFPTENWSDWQWWELTANSFSARLNKTKENYRPILQVIDHAVRNDKLGAIMETAVGKGKLLICTFDITSDLEHRLVARQLRRSIIQYMNSENFAPKNVPELIDLFFDNNRVDQKITNLTENPGTIKIEFSEPRYIIGCHLYSKGSTKQVGNFNIYISDNKQDKGRLIISGKGLLNVDYNAELWDNGFTLQKGGKGKFLTVEFEDGKWDNINIEEFKLIFGD